MDKYICIVCMIFELVEVITAQRTIDLDRGMLIRNVNPSKSFLLSSILPTNGTCGKIMNDDDDEADQIVGGRPTQLNAQPWMVDIGFKFLDSKPSEFFLICGGSLITNSHVLTAAHCLVNTKRSGERFVARLGDMDLNPLIIDHASPIDILIDRVIPHEEYFQDQNVNDIGILKLKHRVTFNNHIKPICLPSKSEMIINYNKISIVAGWGDTKAEIHNQHSTFNSRLMEVELSLVRNEKCQKLYAPDSSAVIDDRVVCAGNANERKDSCQGDSGGPLMLEKHHQHFVIGIVSYGSANCTTQVIPGVYTRVSFFIDWIHQKLVEK